MPAEPDKTWEVKATIHPRQLLGGKISPCGRYVVAGDFDGNLQRWTLDDDRKATIEHHETWVQAIAFHPEGRRMYSADFWGHIAAWNYEGDEPRLLWSKNDAHAGWIRTALVTRDGQWLVTAGNDLVLRLWDAATGNFVRSLEGHTSHVYSLAQHPGGDLVSGDQEGAIKQWNLGTGRLVRDLDARGLFMTPEASMSLTGVGGVRSIGFSGKGDRLYAGGLTDSSSAGFAQGKPHLLAFRWSDGRLESTLRFRDPFEGFVNQLLWHPDGFLIGAGGGVGGALWFWRPGEDDPFHTVRQLKHIRELSLHPDGIRLAAICFESRGQGGNGRRNMTPEEYVENIGAVRIYSMSERPARPAPARR